MLSNFSRSSNNLVILSLLILSISFTVAQSSSASSPSSITGSSSRSGTASATSNSSSTISSSTTSSAPFLTPIGSFSISSINTETSSTTSSTTSSSSSSSSSSTSTGTMPASQTNEPDSAFSLRSSSSLPVFVTFLLAGLGFGVLL